MFYNHKFLTLILLIFALLFIAMVTQNADIAWMMVLPLMMVGYGIFFSPVKDQINLQVIRSVEKIFDEKDACLIVTLSVHNQGVDIPRITLIDPMHKGSKIIKGSHQQTLSIKSGETYSFQYTLSAGRGIYTWNTIRCISTDPLGIIETDFDIPYKTEIQVQPEIKKFRPFSIKPQSTLHTAGSIPARRGGRGTHFWGIREYHPGDYLTHLDWRLAARHPHQFFTKEFEQEEIADIGLVLDARQSINIKVGKDCIFEHSISAAASLAEVFLRQGNRVSLLVFGEPIIYQYPGYGKNQLNRILHTLSQASIDSDRGPKGFVYLPTNMFSSHSLLIFISPLAPMDHKLFPRLRASGFQLLLISPNPMLYAQLLIKNKAIDRLALHLTEMDHRLEILKISNLWIPVIDWQVTQPLAPLVRNALNRVHIQQQH